jgi:phosphoribosyl 1,2-cyclic phosphodiesterase
MRIKVWGTRGSIPCPGPDTVRYGGNTSCVQVTLADDTQLVLDAGTGIRNLTFARGERPGHIHILLTHLHLDHIQGLLFFALLFEPEIEVTIWGPPSPGGSLQNRIARYLSAPLSPVEVRELPCRLQFRHCPGAAWTIGAATIRAEAVNHRGPTIGFRITEQDATLCYLPDHEPALTGPLEQADTPWISGYALARDADVLLHDCQYSDEEYRLQFGWGHSALSDALCFARRSHAKRTLLTHHDPRHTDDQLDAMLTLARERWRGTAAPQQTIEMAAEGDELEIGSSGSRSGSGSGSASGSRRTAA